MPAASQFFATGERWVLTWSDEASEHVAKIERSQPLYLDCESKSMASAFGDLAVHCNDRPDTSLFPGLLSLNDHLESEDDDPWGVLVETIGNAAIRLDAEGIFTVHHKGEITCAISLEDARDEVREIQKTTPMKLQTSSDIVPPIVPALPQDVKNQDHGEQIIDSYGSRNGSRIIKLTRLDPLVHKYGYIVECFDDGRISIDMFFDDDDDGEQHARRLFDSMKDGCDSVDDEDECDDGDVPQAWKDYDHQLANPNGHGTDIPQ